MKPKVSSQFSTAYFHIQCILFQSNLVYLELLSGNLSRQNFPEMKTYSIQKLFLIPQKFLQMNQRVYTVMKCTDFNHCQSGALWQVLYYVTLPEIPEQCGSGMVESWRPIPLARNNTNRLHSFCYGYLGGGAYTLLAQKSKSLHVAMYVLSVTMF